jgi:hypothetical protein
MKNPSPLISWGLLALLLLSAWPATAQVAPYWVLYINDAGELVALNPQSLESQTWYNFQSPLGRQFSFHPAPDGQHLAVYLQTEDGSQQQLYVFAAADQSLILAADLLPPNFSPPPPTLGDPAYELTRALGEVLWSPGGDVLAFVSGANGTADIALFAPSTGALTYANTESSSAAFMAWQSEGAGLIFAELASFGDGGGYQVLGYRYAPAGGTSLELSLENAAGGVHILGWPEADRFYYSRVDFAGFGAAGLFLYDLAAQTSTELIPPSITFSLPAWDAETASLGLSVPAAGGGGLVPGAYLWRGGELNLLQSGAFYLTLHPRPGRFQYEAESGSYLLDLSASSPVLAALPPHQYGAFVSPGQELVVLSRAEGVFVSRLGGDDSSLVWGEQSLVPVWSPGGEAYYSFGFTAEGGGLVEVNALERRVQLLDSRMAPNSPRAVLSPP